MSSKLIPKNKNISNVPNLLKEIQDEKEGKFLAYIQSHNQNIEKSDLIKNYNNLNPQWYMYFNKGTYFYTRPGFKMGYNMSGLIQLIRQDFNGNSKMKHDYGVLQKWPLDYKTIELSAPVSTQSIKELDPPKEDVLVLTKQLPAVKIVANKQTGKVKGHKYPTEVKASNYPDIDVNSLATTPKKNNSTGKTAYESIKSFVSNVLDKWGNYMSKTTFIPMDSRITVNPIPTLQSSNREPAQQSRSNTSASQKSQTKQQNTKPAYEQQNSNIVESSKQKQQSLKKSTKKLVSRQRNDFHEKWQEARDNGQLTFNWRGQEFNTMKRGESEEQWLKNIGKTKNQWEDKLSDMKGGSFTIPDNPLPVISIEPSQKPYDNHWQYF